jgi:GDP-L-fucose synthase
MSILVTGATGFLGKRICRRLDADGMEYIPASKSLGTDFRDMTAFNALFESNKIERIIHCATYIGGIQFGLQHPAEIFFNNALINANLFELAHRHGVQRIVNPISNCSYPRDVTGSFREEQWWDGELDQSVMVYGFIRKGSWMQSWAYWKQYGLQTINLIVPNMYGPNDHFDEVRSHALGALIMKICNAKANNIESVTVWGTGSPVREWLYVDDCVEAMIRALDIPHSEQPVNIGIGYGVTIKELAETIKRIASYNGALVFDASKPDGAPFKVMNIDRCREVFGWAPSTALDAGIEQTISWYENHNK